MIFKLIRSAKRLIATYRAATQLQDALKHLLETVEGDACCPTAYGMRVEDPEHPYHEDVTRARKALAVAGGL